MKKTLRYFALFVTVITQAQTYNSSGPLPIADGSLGCGSNSATPGLTTSTIVVPLTGNLANPASLSINLDLTHTWIGDLTVEIETPTATKCALLKRIGATGATPDTDCGDNSNFAIGNILSFNSTNVTPIDFAAGTTAYNIPGGSYAPTGADPTVYPNTASLCDLTTFLNGQPISGTWTLHVRDSGGGDTGTINGWSLVFTTLSNEEFLFNNAVSVLGNPFENELVVKVNNLNASQGNIKLYAMDGKLVNQTKLTHFETSTAIETASLAKGVYLLVAEIDGINQKAIRVIKK